MLGGLHKHVLKPHALAGDEHTGRRGQVSVELDAFKTGSSQCVVT